MSVANLGSSPSRYVITPDVSLYHSFASYTSSLSLACGKGKEGLQSLICNALAIVGKVLTVHTGLCLALCTETRSTSEKTLCGGMNFPQFGAA